VYFSLGGMVEAEEVWCEYVAGIIGSFNGSIRERSETGCRQVDGEELGSISRATRTLRDLFDKKPL
jgi:hypothetical protein